MSQEYVQKYSDLQQMWQCGCHWASNDSCMWRHRCHWASRKHKTNWQYTKRDIYSTKTKLTVMWHIGIATEFTKSTATDVQLAAVEASKARVDTQPHFALCTHYARPLIVLAWTTQTTTVIGISLLREVVARLQSYIFMNTHQFPSRLASESVSHEWHSLQRGSSLPRTESTNQSSK